MFNSLFLKEEGISSAIISLFSRFSSSTGLESLQNISNKCLNVNRTYLISF